MAAGDIIIPDNTITPEIMQKIAAEVTKLINTNAKDPGQWEVVTSTNGVASLPVLQVMGSTYKLVRLAVSTLQGVNGREVELQMNAARTAIQWRYVAVSGSDLQPTEWRTLIEVNLLKGDPGETPTFRTGENGIEWKYKSEGEDTWRILVAYDVLKLKFSDLSSENIAEFWRNVPADVMAEFRKPATDAAKIVTDKMSEITTEANQRITDLRQLEAAVEEKEEERENFYSRSQAMVQDWSNDEQGRKDAEADRELKETERQTKEIIRQEKEDERIVEEALRKKSEEGRDDNEAIRQRQEDIREEGTVKAILNAETATDRLNALSDHRDEIREGYWWRWNETTKEWYNTGEIAKGNVMYATFDVDENNDLYMFTDEEYTGPGFVVDDEDLFVTLKTE